ncbi:hypothetical protein KIW84_043162 [Lathyrus oleraceus]|uniref:Peptidase S8/S53 domain-containing protein n=1 Tax=Pisum sativum TaxID=3888 RepID=A0A9D5ARF8_PEA|nr:hypothetical protein KIW84_043162 [Pisum sativum]
MDSELEIEGETIIPDALVLEAREDEVWLMPNGDFKSVKIGENPSRACPHASGIAALIMSIHPDWSRTAIHSALITTAYPTYNDNKKLATPFDFGAEHMKPARKTKSHKLLMNYALSYHLCRNTMEFTIKRTG